MHPDDAELEFPMAPLNYCGRQTLMGGLLKLGFEIGDGGKGEDENEDEVPNSEDVKE